MMKKCMLIISIAIFLCIFIVFLKFEYAVPHKLLGTTTYFKRVGSIEFIRLKDDSLYSQLDLSQYDVDFNKNDILVSHGCEIEKINYNKEIFVLKSRFITIWLDEKDAKDLSYIYLIPKDLYFDEHFHPSTYIIR